MAPRVFVLPLVAVGSALLVGCGPKGPAAGSGSIGSRMDEKARAERKDEVLPLREDELPADLLSGGDQVVLVRPDSDRGLDAYAGRRRVYLWGGPQLDCLPASFRQVGADEFTGEVVVKTWSEE